MNLTPTKGNYHFEMILLILIGRAERVDSLNADICTYDPFTVYYIKAGFKLNKELSKKYNEDKYVWAGLEPSEKIRVLCPQDGKPKILK